MPGSIVNAMPGRERRPAVADIVDVDAEEMAGAVRIPHLVLVARCIGDEAQLQQACLDHLDRLVVHVLQRYAGAGRRIASLLSLQHDAVDVLVERGKRAADRVACA